MIYNKLFHLKLPVCLKTALREMISGYLKKKNAWILTFATRESRYNGKILSVYYKIKQKCSNGFWITTAVLSEAQFLLHSCIFLEYSHVAEYWLLHI